LTHLNNSERESHVQDMFARIAPRYDLMNRLMTFGQDTGWRREVIQRARLSGKSRLLDLGAGTGDLAAEALHQCPSCQVVAADFTLPMMRVGQTRLASASLDWSAADAGCLPFPSGRFNAVVSGFLLRNVTNLRQSLAEQYRVLKLGGRIVSLDTTPPPRTLLAPFIRLHLHTVIPTLGKLVSGNPEAYHYLPDSTEAFLEPERLAGLLITAGFREVGFLRMMFGTVAIHWGIK
jgi:demethylmenaquinone methyltransferase/2-methoxy-6-polyprenyl-1,4-benzoquinol methylase